MENRKNYKTKFAIGVIWLVWLVSIMMFDMQESASAMGTEQYQVDDFVVGGIWISDGSGKEYNDSRRMRTGFWPLGTVTIEWEPQTELQYSLVFYDSALKLITATPYRSASVMVHEGDPNGAEYVRILLRFPDNDKRFDETYIMPKTCRILSSENKLTVYDVPENDGVKNAISRAKQCTTVTYTTRAELPGQSGDIVKNIEVHGIMYSSTREESLYVPNAVSFESYLSAMDNPNSYLYTRQSQSKNSKTYYGTVCSAFVCYCYNLPCIYTTYQLGTLEQMNLLDDQSIDNIQLGDIILRKNAHVLIVVGIERDIEGNILNITEAEAVNPQVRLQTYSRDSFSSLYLEKGYQIYRYALLDQVPEPREDIASIRRNENLCPRRGNKSNWPEGETVEIDVLDTANYDRVALCKDGELFLISDIPNSLCISYEELESGKYEAFLSDGEHRSEPVSFIVADTHVLAECLGSGMVKISFSSSNAVPRWYAWCFADKSISDYMAVSRAYELSKEDLILGYTISKYKLGEWLLKVEFETEYGLISSSLYPLDVH